ncbi:hypothetical protein WJX74_010771 [Apatococcus lobatus]|uniref:Uncharacterized protein n=1 Tax=Apatococcus lobatus TaxID=904363 RepID=A0AAW1QL60_9CHLO
MDPAQQGGRRVPASFLLSAGTKRHRPETASTDQATKGGSDGTLQPIRTSAAASPRGLAAPVLAKAEVVKSTAEGPEGQGNAPSDSTAPDGKPPGRRKLPGSFAPQPSRTPAATGNSTATRPPALVSPEDTQAALKAAVEGLAMSGGLEERQATPGMLLVPLLRHQRMALAWMSRRETGASAPRGGILADDQGLGKTVSTISLMVSEAPPEEWGTPHYVSQCNAAAAAPSASASSGAQAGASTPPDAQASTSEDGQPAADADASLQAESSLQGEHDAPVAPGGLKDARPSRKRARLKGREHTSRKPLGPHGGTLIIAPTAVLNQWDQELAAKASPAAGIVTHVYHGKGRGLAAAALARFGCVVTTYTTLAMEAPDRPQHGSGPLDYCSSSSNEDDDVSATTPAGRWQEFCWQQKEASWAPISAWSLKAERRWCLSGTPIQNSIDDLYPYMRFLRYEPYARQSSFKSLIKEPLLQQPELGTERLRAVLKGILLRRTKQTKIDGEPVVKLPPREVSLVKQHFNEQEQTLYNELAAQSKAKFKELDAEGSGGAYVQALYMMLRLRQACNHPWLLKPLDTKSPVKPSAAQLAAARKLDPEVRAGLLTLVGGIEGGSEMGQCTMCEDIPEDPVVSACGHPYCRQCISAQVGSAKGDQETPMECPACNATISAMQVFSPAALRQAETGSASATTSSLAAKGAAKHQATWQSSSKIDQLLAVLQAVRQKTAELAEKDKQSTGILSGKSKSNARLAALLGGSRAALAAAANIGGQSSVAGDKVIVFSQWTGMLDLVEIALKKEKYQYRRLDGTMSVAARDTSITDFKTLRGVDVLLVSLKAAALGLNLTAANHVVLMDPWFNPTIEDQAIDRAHRIGQSKAVHVTRITIAGTIEDWVLQIQEKKRHTADAAFGGDAGRAGANRVTMDDLRFLFSAA